MVVLSSVFFFGGRGPVSFRAVKGEGGESALEFGVVSVFVLGGAGGPPGPGVLPPHAAPPVLGALRATSSELLEA